MARTRALEPQQKSNAVIASAVRLPGAPVYTGHTNKGVSGERTWQREAWRHYDGIGEYAFAANWIGNLLSRATLFATQDEGQGPKRCGEGTPADSIMDEFFSSTDGRQGMLQQAGIHFTVPGEFYIVAWENEDGQQWRVVSSADMKFAQGAWFHSDVMLPGDATVIHCWRPHPRKWKEPTSPSRAALPILSEIERLTMHVSAQVDSRLAGAGILWVPNEIAVAATPGKTVEGAQAESTAQSFVTNLTEVMSTAIANREDASALVPIVVTADGEFIEKVTHTTFWSNLDENTGRMRKEAVERLALSLDLPPEVLTGVGEANHWSAWQVDESAVKAHAEPLLSLITRDIAQGWLRPALGAVYGMDSDETRAYGVRADTSEMRLRPNRSKEALELYDRGELKAEALLRETGFGADDATGPEDKAAWLMKKVASGSTTPEQVAAAAAAMGVPLPVSIGEVESQEARPTPSLREHPVREIPAEPSAALLAASEQMVFRALERAGNRLRTATGTRPPGVGAAEVYLYVPCGPGRVDDVLMDAWSHVDRFAGSLGVDPEVLSAALDSYCRVLITEQKPHDPSLMRSYVALTRLEH